jgi:hypothetical protein
VAAPALRAMSAELLGEALAGAELQGRKAVMAVLPQLYDRYVTAIATPPAAALAARELSRATRLA